MTLFLISVSVITRLKDNQISNVLLPITRGQTVSHVSFLMTYFPLLFLYCLSFHTSVMVSLSNAVPQTVSVLPTLSTWNNPWAGVVCLLKWILTSSYN